MTTDGADQIKTFSFADAVRKRPGMYVGACETPDGANHMVLELAANGVDQYLAGHVTEIAVQIDGHRVMVRDDGPGLDPNDDVQFQ